LKIIANDFIRATGCWENKAARDCCPSCGLNVLPNGYSMSVHTFARQVANCWNFCENDRFLPITLEKWMAASECENALFVM